MIENISCQNISYCFYNITNLNGTSQNLKYLFGLYRETLPGPCNFEKVSAHDERIIIATVIIVIFFFSFRR